MKRIQRAAALLLALLLTAVSLPSASAAETDCEEALPFHMTPEEKRGFVEKLISSYETVYYYNTFLAAIDLTRGGADEVIAAVSASGLTDPFPRSVGNTREVEYVWETSKFGSMYQETLEEKENIVYLSGTVREPQRENFGKLRQLLAAFPAVVCVYQAAIACMRDEASPGVSLKIPLDSVMVAVDCADLSPETIGGELKSMPFVADAELVASEEDLALGHAEFFVSIKYPCDVCFPAFLRASAEKEYVEGWCIEPAAGAVQDPGALVFSFGDTDLNEEVSVGDARKILRFAVGLDRPADALIRILSDVDRDGEITVSDARAALRTAVGLTAEKQYYVDTPNYAGLISAKSVGLRKNGDTLLITASTAGPASVEKCGFRFIRLQRLEGGVWTDVPGCCYTDLYNDSNTKVFSVSVAAAKGYRYRVVCEHYAETTYLSLYTQSASARSVSLTVEM